MPSHLHEALLQLFRNRPQLAPELLRDALHVPLPEYTEARIESADLNDLQPTEYRADLVVLLLDGQPVLGIVVEVQLARDESKHYVWPVYVANLRARIRCPVCLLVVAADDAVARWAGKTIDLGGGNAFTPRVLAPAGVPEVTDEMQARADPELAVLSAMAHGKDTDIEKSVRIAAAAMAASSNLDADRFPLYLDLVLNSLTEAARRALQAMDPAKYEFQSDFAKRFIAVGKEEGEAEGLTKGRIEGRVEGRVEGELEGRIKLVLRLLGLRYGPLSDAVQAQVRALDGVQLDALAERILRAASLDEVLRGF